uniref:Alpha-1,3-mannosyl-glycoprotein 2-beta-N-acetylglucosaminyltransferase n=1 Tax=Lutzomyia longipalpis TaxID=7200 RepID=A0A1B0CI87_LUTLO
MRLVHQFLIVTFVSVWVIVTYIVFWRPGTAPGYAHTREEDSQYSEFLEKIIFLEKEVERRNQEYQRLLVKLLVLLENTPINYKQINPRKLPVVVRQRLPRTAYGRYPSNCLDNLIQYRPNKKQFPIIVSQDCDDEPTRNVIQSYKQQVSLISQPDQSDIVVPPKDKKFKGYYKI